MVEPTLSCGIVLARETPDGWMTLMLRAWHHWDFPKGLREEGEESLQAALREVREETSIDEVSFEWGERHMETGPYSRGKTARYFLARTHEEKVVMGPSPVTGEPEHQEWKRQVLAGEIELEEVDTDPFNAKNMARPTKAMTPDAAR